jgi:hypothetical protein
VAALPLASGLQPDRSVGTFSASQTDDLSAHWIARGILRAAVYRPATMRGRPRGGCVQSLILLDRRTVAICAALIATSEVVLAQHPQGSPGSTHVTVTCALPAGERRECPADTSAGVTLVSVHTSGSLLTTLTTTPEPPQIPIESWGDSRPAMTSSSEEAASESCLLVRTQWKQAAGVKPPPRFQRHDACY